jgi:hypothetical protein
MTESEKLEFENIASKEYARKMAEWEVVHHAIRLLIALHEG